VKLSDRQPLFVGFKMDSSLRRQLEAVSGPDQRYISKDSSDFLRICEYGEDQYVGKVVEERLTTDRVDDVRRNVLSILQRLCPETRLPVHLEIWVCSTAEIDAHAAPPPPADVD